MDSTSKKPYRLGVALSGGGARGFAHVGALKALEETGMKPDIIAGVSAGAIVAVLYAAGVSTDRMLEIFADRKMTDFCEMKVRGGGFFKIERFKNILLKEIGSKYKNLEDLPIKTCLGVTDLVHGCPVAIESGPIGDAVMASCSIPILFHPVTIGGVRYVDGGVLRNLPAWIIRDRCDYLIGMNCSPLIADDRFKNNVFDVAMRTYALMTKANQKEDMDMCDLSVEMSGITGYRAFNLKEIKQVYIFGYSSAKSALKHSHDFDHDAGPDVDQPIN